MIIADKDKNKIFKYNNDGEPHRAKIGENMMKILKENYGENNDENVMIVVIRHWLGTKLGLKNLYKSYDIVAKSMFDKNNTGKDLISNENNKHAFKVSSGCIVIILSIAVVLLSYIVYTICSLTHVDSLSFHTVLCTS